MNPPNSSAFAMADRLLGGQLVERLTEHRQAGHSAETIARNLFAEAGVNVSARTIGNWCHQLGIPAGTDEPEVATA